MPEGYEDYHNQCDEIDKSDAIFTTSWRWWAATELEWFDRGTSDVDGYEGCDGDDADADEEEEASQADDGLTQTLENWGSCTREWEDWTVYCRPVKYNNGEANAMASDVCEAKTVLYSVTRSQC